MSKLFKTTIDDLLSERYLSYAISTIISRSLPDVRDGLKASSQKNYLFHVSIKINAWQSLIKNVQELWVMSWVNFIHMATKLFMIV